MKHNLIGYVFVILAFIAALFAFFIAYAVSRFFIAPIQYRLKSPYTIFLMKLGIAAGAAFWTFLAATYGLTILFHTK